MEYKIIVVQGHEIAKLEGLLNGLAEQGFQAIHFFESANRLIGIMERNKVPLIFQPDDTDTINVQGEPTNVIIGEPVQVRKVGWPKEKPRKKVTVTSAE